MRHQTPPPPLLLALLLPLLLLLLLLYYYYCTITAAATVGLGLTGLVLQQSAPNRGRPVPKSNIL